MNEILLIELAQRNALLAVRIALIGKSLSTEELEQTIKEAETILGLNK